MEVRNQERKMNINLYIMRIIATIMVLSVHIAQYSGYDFSVGAKGVEMFFVLSGYLAFASLDKSFSFVDYYKRRIKRIVPLYWFCLIILYLEQIFFAIYEGRLADAFVHQCNWRFLRYFFFLQGVIPSDNWSLWNNFSALWTMSAFMFFYLLAPILYKLIKKFYVGLVVAVILLILTTPFSNLLIDLLKGYPKEAQIEWFAISNPLAVLFCFLFGVVVYLAKKENKSVFLSCIIVIVLVVTKMESYQYELLFTLFLVIMTSFDIKIHDENVIRFIKLVSEMSFALYLFHPAIVRDFATVLTKFHVETVWIKASLFYIFSFVGTYVLYYLLFKPLMRKIIGSSDKEWNCQY